MLTNFCPLFVWNSSGAFLYIVILLANIDYKGLLDYSLKALLGGVIWFGYKIIGEHYILKIRKEHKEKNQLRDMRERPSHAWIGE